MGCCCWANVMKILKGTFGVEPISRRLDILVRLPRPFLWLNNGMTREVIMREFMTGKNAHPA